MGPSEAMPPRRLRLEHNGYLSRSGSDPVNSSTSVGFGVWQAVAVVMRRSLAASIAAILLLSGCGSHAHSAAPPAQKVAAAFKGAPAPLAALHARANHLIGGGPNAFTSLLRRLRGYPVVVNKWASWCPPCRTEFPLFQKASVAYGRRVAFIGLNGHQDTVSKAAEFLRSFPVTYPSYEDPNEAIARTLEAATYDPMTVFIDRHGVIRYAKAGEYVSLAALEHDIKLYVQG
jgi:cytochrome c biogenesis protein CcmG/thiol:disulfide interchange protein DsbE